MVSSTGHGHASINNIHIVNGKFEAATIVAVLLLKKEMSSLICIDYVYHYLKAHKNDVLVPYMRGAANVSLSVGRLEGVKIPLPESIQVQQKMVCELVRIDEEMKVIKGELKSRQKLLNDKQMLFYDIT